MPYGGSPSTSPNDRLKFLVGDQSTSIAGELLSTKECAYLIGVYGSAVKAAPAAAQSIAASLATKVDKSVGDLRIAAQQKYDHYMSLYKSLQRTVSFSAVPYAGGISQDDKSDIEVDTDRVPPAFQIGVHDSIRNPQPGGRASTASTA